MSDKAKELLFDEEARLSLKKGIEALTSVVSVTLGPLGRQVGIDTKWGAPKISSDGNQIAQEVLLANPFENMGVSMGKEVASKMKEQCGDGTTTSLVLLGALVNRGIQAVSSGACPILVKRGMEKGKEAICAQLKIGAKEIRSRKEIQAVATAAASGIAEIGEMIGLAYEKVGKGGIISIEEAQGVETSIEMVEVMQFDRGYLSSYFCTNQEKMIVEMVNPHILVTDKKISSLQDILPLLKGVAMGGGEILIIADEIDGDALSTLVINRLKGTLKVCAVKAPGFGEQRKEMLIDIALLTGASFVSQDTGISFKEVSIDATGKAEKILVSKEKTTIIGGLGDKANVKSRIAQIELASKGASSSYDKEKLEDRKAKLSGGVALIRVGAPTEAALKEKKQLFEDSLSSTKAALEEGVVTGGGVALLQAMTLAKKGFKLEGDEAIGASLVFDACLFPFLQIVENSGHNSQLALEEVKNGSAASGFNVATGKVEDLAKLGISDPHKMVRMALSLSVSAAGMILLSDCLIGETE